MDEWYDEKPDITMTVEIPTGEWRFIQDELRELERLRKSNAEYARRDADYLAWSLGGGMAKAVLAGMEMARSPNGERL